ncbi:MAG: ribonuclease Z [Clostridia bacterium]|nr:ribonuclease Z [Clostridia bacterium]
MNIIVCLDNNNGMLFNKRRQSRDRELILRIKELTEGHRLWMNAYSARLFGDDVFVADDFIAEAGTGDYCFIENTPIPTDSIEQIIIYHWNREYPSDTYFDLDISGMKLISRYEFKGYSHDTITEEIYEQQKI